MRKVLKNFRGIFRKKTKTHTTDNKENILDYRLFVQ